MEAEEIAWKGMKGIGKGLKAGASGALKVAEKTSMAVLETNDKINELQYAGASGPKKTTHLDSDARAAMKARAAAAKEPEMEDLGPDQSGDGFLGDLKSRAKSATDAVASTTATVAAKTKETAGAATAKTLEVGKATGGSVMAVAGLDDTAAARERAAGGGQEIQFDEDGNPIIPDAPAKGAVATAGGIVGGVVGKTGGLVGAVVGTTLEVGQKAGGGLKDVVVGDDKDAARARAAGGGQEIKFDADGNPILPDAKGGGGGIGSMVGGLAGGMGGLAGKAKAKAEAAALQAKKVVPGAEEGVPPAEAEPEVEPEQARAIVRNSKWARKD